MKICGIDPGLASGGLVLVESAGDGTKVLASYSLVEKRGAAQEAKKTAKARSEESFGWGDIAFTAAADRSEGWIRKVTEALGDIEENFGKINYFAIESFVDQPSRARQEKSGLLRNRWQTPLSMGRLAEELLRRGYSPERGNLFYQNAGTVLTQWKTEIALLEKRKRGKEAFLPGDEIVTNDHERKALVHALALSLRLGEKGNLHRQEGLYLGGNLDE